MSCGFRFIKKKGNLYCKALTPLKFLSIAGAVLLFDYGYYFILVVK